MLCHAQNPEKHARLKRIIKVKCKKALCVNSPILLQTWMTFFPFVKHKRIFFVEEWQKCSCFSFVLYLICSYSHCSYSNYAYLKNTQGPNKSHVWICSRTNDDDFQFVLHTRLLNDYLNIGRSCVDYFLSFFFFFSFWNLTAPEHSSKKASHAGLEENEGD